MKIAFDQEVALCYHCEGSGRDPFFEDAACDECDGSGTLPLDDFLDDEEWDRTIPMDDLLDERY